MDPNETLTKILACVAQMRSLQGEGPRAADAYEEEASELADLVEALDTWLTTKGFLPKRWECKPCGIHADRNAAELTRTLEQRTLELEQTRFQLGAILTEATVLSMKDAPSLIIKFDKDSNPEDGSLSGTMSVPVDKYNERARQVFTFAAAYKEAMKVLVETSNRLNAAERRLGERIPVDPQRGNALADSFTRERCDVDIPTMSELVRALASEARASVPEQKGPSEEEFERIMAAAVAQPLKPTHPPGIVKLAEEVKKGQLRSWVEAAMVFAKYILP